MVLIFMSTPPVSPSSLVLANHSGSATKRQRGFFNVSPGSVSDTFQKVVSNASTPVSPTGKTRKLRKLNFDVSSPDATNAEPTSPQSSRASTKSCFSFTAIKFTPTPVKINEDWVLEYSIRLGKTCHKLKLLKPSEIPRDHQVWISDQNLVAKTYHHLLPESKRKRVAEADFYGFEKIQIFLVNNEIKDVRVAKLHNNPLQDGILFMEYIEGNERYWEEWERGSSVANLSRESQQILISARNLIECMWKNKTDLGDFRPENVIWSDNQLVIIDYNHETDTQDLVGHLQSYIAKWAKGNLAVKEYLFENLQDLKEKVPYAQISRSLL